MTERELRTLLRSISASLRSIEHQIHTIGDQQKRWHEQQESANNPPIHIPTLRAELQIPERIEREQNTDSNRNRRVQIWLTVGTWLAFIAAAVYAEITYRQKIVMDATFSQIQQQTAAAKSAAETAGEALLITNRPWVKVQHRIIKPLDFTFVGASGPAATMTVEDTLENVGQTVALNVLSWEEVIPMDSDYSHRTAVARQNEWCGTNRNSDQTRRIGSILFPHTPEIQSSGTGTLMSKVAQALRTSPIQGKVGFVMVGCVVYRSSFEPLDQPNHQTRFMYELGIPQSFGGWMPWIIPTGIPPKLQLIETFQTYTAD